MREELINLMSIIPDELKPDVYARIKSFISAMIYDLHIQIDDVAYNDSNHSSMDKIPMMTSMMKIAAREMNIPENMLWSTKRQKEFVQLRQILMWTFRMNYPQIPLRMISELFQRDHATILHAIKQIESSISTDPIYRGVMENLFDVMHHNGFDLSNAVHRFEQLRNKALVK
jgi:chromosomal replication initiation ATPase DnaA